MAEYSRMAKGSFTATGAYQYVNIPFQPQKVVLVNQTNQIAGITANKVVEAMWDAGTNKTLVKGWDNNSAWNTGTVATNGISAFSANLAFQFGAQQQVVATTGGASTCNFEVTGHGYNTGDVVMFEGLYSTQYTAGMPQMCGIPFTITKVDANNFTVTWASNGSNYTNLAASPSGAYVKKVLYPDLYFPGVSVIYAITKGTSTTIKTTTPHNMVVGQEVAFRITSDWGTSQLNSLPNNTIPGSPIYGFVTSVSDAYTVVVNIDSSSYTAFTSNVAVSNVSGLTFPQMVAVGDVNTGGWPITSTSPYYPSPFVNNTGTSGAYRSINGPAIQGAFANNTRQGFFIGSGTVTPVAWSSATIMANADVVLWYAYLYDYANP